MSHDASIAGTAELKSAIERAEGVREALDKCGRKQQAAKISEIITSAQHMRFAIGVVGHAKRGKSTLINGLLGRSDDMMAPVDRFPATNVVSCFADGAKQEIKVFSLSEGGPPKLITATEIKKHLIGQVVSVHRHEYREVSQAGQQRLGNRRLSSTRGTRDAENRACARNRHDAGALNQLVKALVEALHGTSPRGIGLTVRISAAAQVTAAHLLTCA